MLQLHLHDLFILQLEVCISMSPSISPLCHRLFRLATTSLFSVTVSLFLFNVLEICFGF